MNNAALILAKEGSKGFPGKNILPWRGKPLLIHTIEDCQASGLFSDIFVSTNGKKIAKIAETANAHVIRRPSSYAANEKYVDSVNHAVTYIQQQNNLETITIPMVVQPIRESGIFKRMLDLHAPNVDSVVTVSRFNASIDWIYERDEKSQQLKANKQITYGSDIARRDNLYVIDNALTSFTLDSWRSADGKTPWPYLGQKIVAIEQHRRNTHYNIDINTPEDAEWLKFIQSFPSWENKT